MDKAKIQKAVKDILEAIGEDPKREGLRDTPRRVADMYEEIFSGISKNADDDLKVFFEKEQPNKSFKSILSCALQAEKDSIVFYLGMKELVSAKSGQSKIEAIIKEEMSHIQLLAGKLTEYY